GTTGGTPGSLRRDVDARALMASRTAFRNRRELLRVARPAISPFRRAQLPTDTPKPRRVESPLARCTATAARGNRARRLAPFDRYCARNVFPIRRCVRGERSVERGGESCLAAHQVRPSDLQPFPPALE